ncbi:hypothetical protein TNCV_62671 [Trichonephila clavipes]|nr:hypothetical protein TNCV_62671 [Trichonephila clavipes]
MSFPWDVTRNHCEYTLWHYITVDNFHPYAGAIGDAFVSQDDSTRPHRARCMKFPKRWDSAMVACSNSFLMCCDIPRQCCEIIR